MSLEHVSTQEVPCVTGVIVRAVETYVTAPDHRRPRLAHRSRQTGGLRIVEDHDVPRMHELDQLGGVGGQGLVVDLVLGGAQRTTVACETVQAVVNALGDHEELGTAGDHRPSGVDAGAPGIAEQRPQHLDDAAALCGRVHVPDDLTVKITSTVGDQIAQRLELADREHRLEAQRIHRFDRHMLQGRHNTPLPLLSVDPPR